MKTQLNIFYLKWGKFGIEEYLCYQKQKTCGSIINFVINTIVCMLLYIFFFLEINTLDFSHENKCLIHSPSDLPLPLGKQEEAEMCFLLEYETASLAKAQAGIALGLKATGRSRVSLLYIHCTLHYPHLITRQKQLSVQSFFLFLFKTL